MFMRDGEVEQVKVAVKILSMSKEEVNEAIEFVSQLHHFYVVDLTIGLKATQKQ